MIAKVTSNIVTNITASDSASAPTIRSNIDGKNSDSVKIRTPFAKTKTVIVNQTIDVNEVVNQMDMVNGNSMPEDVSPQNQDTSTIKLTPLSFNLLSNGVVRKYRVGEKWAAMILMLLGRIIFIIIKQIQDFGLILWEVTVKML